VGEYINSAKFGPLHFVAQDKQDPFLESHPTWDYNPHRRPKPFASLLDKNCVKVAPSAEVGKKAEWKHGDSWDTFSG
jgi:hypothetical protein